MILKGLSGKYVLIVTSENVIPMTDRLYSMEFILSTHTK